MAGAAVTLVLLHGFTGSPASWEPVRRLLPDGLRVLAPRLAGHGPEPLILSRFHDEVARLCRLVEERASGAVHLAGYSMGGRVALGMLATRPALFSGATLIGARDGLTDEAERRERRRWEAGWLDLLERDELAAFVDEWEALPMWRSQEGVDPVRREAQRRERLSHTAPGLACAIRALGLASMPGHAEALSRVDLPVLLMTGERDPKFEGLADRLAALLPRARRLTVAGAGHNLLLERPEAVAEALKQGLTE